MKYSIIRVDTDTYSNDMVVNEYKTFNNFDEALECFKSLNPIVHNHDQVVTLTLKDDNDHEYYTRKIEYKKVNLTADQIREKMANMKVYYNYSSCLKYIDNSTIKGFWRCGTPKDYKDIQSRMRQYFYNNDWEITDHRATKDGITVIIP